MFILACSEDILFFHNTALQYLTVLHFLGLLKILSSLNMNIDRRICLIQWIYQVTSLFLENYEFCPGIHCLQ